MHRGWHKEPRCSSTVLVYTNTNGVRHLIYLLPLLKPCLLQIVTYLVLKHYLGWLRYRGLLVLIFVYLFSKFVHIVQEDKVNK